MVHPDLHFVFPIVKNDAKKMTVCDNFLADFREAVLTNPYLTVNTWLNQIGEGKQGQIYTNEGDEIIRKLNLKTYESEYKIMIIWAPEKMHESCANRVLKIIEEPPPKTIFLLISDTPDEIIGTIQSRVQRISIPPINVKDLVAHAQNRYTLPTDELQLLARMAQGSWSHMQALVEQTDEMKINFERFIQLMRLSWALNVKELRAWVDELVAAGREEEKQFLQYAQRMIRENFVLHLKQPTLSYMSQQEQAFAKNFSQFINERNILDIMDELALAEAQIEQNGNGKIILLDLSIKLYRLLKK
jgi:DNA polymerase-3 subunit delta'